ncbi:DMT family transporter [Vreelandella andesensis]|uniref:DMT family transporter n=1 Tax=Vreelandella andesensis TaxID=447567 RepID=A0A3S1DP21_9GAMM|nr:DMT family transporter [Halomonas andesensis]RUR30842.1 DMT family transporter [Halomonas andesensis]
MPYLPVLFMLTSIFLYSLFPLVGVFGTDEVSGFAFAGLSHLLSAIVSVVGAVCLSRNSGCYNLTLLVRDFWQDRIALRQAVASGAVNYLSHAFLFVSFAYISKPSATVVFESWPVLAVFFLVALARNFPNTAEKKRREPIGARVYFLSLVAFLGLIVIMAGDLQAMSSTAGFAEIINSRDAQIGLVLAILSAVFMSYSVALGRNTRVFVEHRYGNCEGKGAELNRALIASAATKVFGALGFLLTIPFVPGILPSMAAMGAESWGWVVLNGVIIVTIGSLTYREALARTNRVELAILWYTTPVFALMWLWLIGGESLTSAVGVGALLIVSSNALLHMRADTTPAFVGVFLSVGITGVIVIMTAPISMQELVNDVSLLDLVALPVGFIGILGGFLLQRISMLHADARHSSLYLIDHLTTNRSRVHVRDVLALIEHRPADLPVEVQNHVRQLRLAQFPVIRPGELLVMWTLGLLSVVCITLFRAESVIGDALAVMTNASLVYIVLHLSFDARVRLEQVIDTMLRKEYDTELKMQNIWSMIVIVVVSVAILVISYFGHLDAVPPTMLP